MQNNTKMKDRNIFINAFILNAVTYGVINMISVFGKMPHVASEYPFLTILIWSMILAAFLQQGWKVMFYVNLMPFLVFFAIPFFISGYSEPNSDVFVSSGGSFVLPRDIYIIGGFLVFSILIQIVINLNGRLNRNPNDYEDDED
ncbi:hypothetical protein [Paenibacillus sp. NPDC093718]|uniref:hypothetical protein n=1 Tax=Paenibacillus sp. NPDC093718 TaxID=3390601 RepID=UPI003CFD47A2